MSFQSQRWGTTDKKKKRQLESSEDGAAPEGGASADVEGEPASATEQNGDMEVEVRFLEIISCDEYIYVLFYR